MPIDFENKYIFVHIPKTGGSTVISRLNTPKFIHNFAASSMQIMYKDMLCINGHIPAFILREFRPETFGKYYKFTFVRNPYDRTISEFLWLHREEELETMTQQEIVDKFDVWLFSYYIERNTSRKCTQKWYIFSKEKRKLLIDEIYRFENFEEDFSKLIQKLNVIPKNMDILKKSKIEIDRNLLLTEKNKQYIYAIFKEDFDYFGYSKEYVWKPK
jgi:hypothetical protein